MMQNSADAKRKKEKKRKDERREGHKKMWKTEWKEQMQEEIERRKGEDGKTTSHQEARTVKNEGGMKI